MTVLGLFWLVGGAILGALHAVLLARAATSLFRGLHLGLLRVVLVAGGLLLAAKLGGLPQAALGWTIGFVGLVVFLGFWRPPWSQSTFSETQSSSRRVPLR